MDENVTSTVVQGEGGGTASVFAFFQYFEHIIHLLDSSDELYKLDEVNIMGYSAHGDP